MKRFQSTRPVRGATVEKNGYVITYDEFQSTRPVRGATVPQQRLGPVQQISIHAPRAGRDKEGQ